MVGATDVQGTVTRLMRHPKSKHKPENTTGLPYTDEELNLDIPFDHKEDRREYVHNLWLAQYEQEERQRQADAMQEAADIGRELIEREEDELESMGLSGALSHVLGTVIPDRAARRFRASMILKRLRELSHLAFIRHGTVTVWPAPSSELAEAVKEYSGEIGDLLDEEEQAFHNVNPSTQTVPPGIR